MASLADIITVAGGGRGAAVARAVRELQHGRLVCLPTDTVYGVAAMPDMSTELYAAKDRASGKPIALLASDEDAVRGLGVVLNRQGRRLADAFWPGPLTLVVDVGDRTEGVRVPDCDLAREIIRACGGLLRVTSANRSGEPPARTAAQAAAAMGESVAVVIDGGPVPGGVASSVVRVGAEGICVIREGALSGRQIENVLGDSEESKANG